MNTRQGGTEESTTHSGAPVYRDVALSIVLGPLRFIAPTVGYFILYPTILTVSGLEVLGLWSLLTTILSYMTLTDIGFSQLLMREAGQGRTAEDTRARIDHLAAQRAYLVVGGVLIAIVPVLGWTLVPDSFALYPKPNLLISAALMITGGSVTLIGRLDAAVLAARRDNAFLQLVAAITPIVVFSTAVGGASMGYPIEAYGAGILASSLMQISLYRRRLQAVHNDWSSTPAPLPWGASLARIADLARRGGYLHLASIGLLVREPIFRLVVNAFTGLAGVGVYDIAMRVTLMTRNFATSGFSVLYPSFATLLRQGEQRQLIQLIRVSTLGSLSLGAVALGGLVVFAPVAFERWLGEFPEPVIAATGILAVWHLLTVANAPFWYLLQATKNERTAAASVWLHTAAVLISLPLGALFHFSLLELLLYWTVTAIPTQLMIYVAVHRRLGLLRQLIASRRLALLMTVIALFIGLTVPAAVNRSAAEAGPAIEAGQVAILTAFALAAAAIVWQPVREFLSLSQLGVRGSRGRT